VFFYSSVFVKLHCSGLDFGGVHARGTPAVNKMPLLSECSIRVFSGRLQGNNLHRCACRGTV